MQAAVPSRRELLRRALAAAGLVWAGPLLPGCGDHAPPADAPTVVYPGLGPLAEPDANGLRLPAGFQSRVLARSGEAVPGGGGHVWHRFPDGGATSPRSGGGWIYVSNAEVDQGAGGTGALVFDAAGTVVDAYAILGGTSRNCAGGATPWGTWLSCEEVEHGRVFECDPTGAVAAVERPALGHFRHEAAAVDPATLRVYLTEDQPDGRLYRFTPAGTRPGGGADLAAGRLEVAEVLGFDPQQVRPVRWFEVPQPNPDVGPPGPATRHQVPASTRFAGGEGIFHHAGRIWFTTKGDNRIWVLDLAAETLALAYDGSGFRPLLRAVDNLTVAATGTAFVAEDGPRQRIVGFGAGGRAGAVLELVGQTDSELTGPAFDPGGTQLTFSSQRGPGAGGAPIGVTYEVTGPFGSL